MHQDTQSHSILACAMWQPTLMFWSGWFDASLPRGAERAVLRQVGALKREMQALDTQVAEAERMLKLADPEVRWAVQYIAAASCNRTAS